MVDGGEVVVGVVSPGVTGALSDVVSPATVVVVVGSTQAIIPIVT